MRKIIVTEFVSLDGIMEDPGGAEKTKYGGWTWSYWNDEIGKFKFEELFACDALLLGRVTYEGFSAAWPERKEDDGGFADKMNTMTKHVVTSILKTLEWKNSFPVTGNITEEISKIKQKDGLDILVYGSRTLVNMLLENKLVDEINLLVYPVVLGSGKRMFEGIDSKVSLILHNSKSYESGVVLLRYKVKYD
jgi:dihydrofolate reductase